MLQAILVRMNMEFDGDIYAAKPQNIIDENDKDELARFFLVLGLFYNDFKSLHYLWLKTQESLDSVQDQTVVTFELGEYAATKNYIQRMMLGAMHEFFRFLEESRPHVTGK